LPQRLAQGLAARRIVGQGPQAASQIGHVGKGGVYAQVAQVFAAHWHIERHCGQAHGHIVEQFAGALGARDLGRDGDVAQSQEICRLFIGHLAGEGDMIAQPQRLGLMLVDLHMWIARDQKVKVAPPVAEQPRRLQKMSCALILGQQPQINYHQPLGGDAPGRLALRPGGVARGRRKDLGIDAIGHHGDPSIATVELLRQQRRRVVRTGEDVGAGVINALLQGAHEPKEAAIGLEKAVIQHLAREAALKVEHQWRPPQPVERPADQGPLVQVGVDHSGPHAEQGRRGAQQEQGVESDLVARRADLVALAPGDAHGATDVEAGQVAAVVVGADRYLMAQPLQQARLLQDAHMAAIIGKERGGRDHQDARGGARHTYSRPNHMRQRILNSSRKARAITRKRAPVWLPALRG